MNHLVDRVPSPIPRTIAAVYLTYFLTAVLSAFLIKGIAVPDNAAATASSILAHGATYRTGIGVDIVGNATYIILTALLYRLLGPVNWTVSLMAAFVSLAGCATQLFGNVFRLSALAIVSSPPIGAAFSSDQYYSLALLMLSLHAHTFSISLVLFGLYDILIGYLIFRSQFLPRFMGMLLICAGIGWLAFLWPPLAKTVAPYVLPFGFLAELALMLWLFVRGVDVAAWKKRAISTSNRWSDPEEGAVA